MSCYNPMHYQVPAFRFSRFTKDVIVPCNYCMSCRLTRSIYLKSICSYYNYMCSLKGLGSSFVTLTYNDDSVPFSADSGLPSLSKYDLQNFNKRLRNILPKNFKNYKFMASGEYGDKFSRPHYHISLLGVPSTVSSQYVFEAWNNSKEQNNLVTRGLIDVGSLNPGGLSYITKYCMKQIRGQKVREVYDNNFVQPPFLIHSKDMEREFINYEINCLRNNNFKSNFFGRPSFVPVQVLKKYCSKSELDRYRVECIRYLRSKPVEERILSIKSKERSLYFSAINSGSAADNTVLQFADVNPIIEV